MAVPSPSVQRLLADLREIHNNPLHLVSAAPLEDDVFTWHVNLLGMEGSPYEGGIFHLELAFPVCCCGVSLVGPLFSDTPFPQGHLPVGASQCARVDSHASHPCAR